MLRRKKQRTGACQVNFELVVQCSSSYSSFSEQLTIQNRNYINKNDVRQIDNIVVRSIRLLLVFYMFFFSNVSFCSNPHFLSVCFSCVLLLLFGTHSKNRAVHLFLLSLEFSPVICLMWVKYYCVLILFSLLSNEFCSHFFFVSLIIGFNNTILLAIALLSPHFLSICFSYFFFSLFLSFSQLWLCLLHYLLWRFLPKPKNIHAHRHIRTTSHIIILNIRVLLEILVIVLPLANALDFVTKTITTSQPTNEMKWNEMNRNLCNEY